MINRRRFLSFIPIALSTGFIPFKRQANSKVESRVRVIDPITFRDHVKRNPGPIRDAMRDAMLRGR